MIDRAMAADRGLVSTDSTSMRSSFTRVIGNCSSDVSDEYPIPKSSSAIDTPIAPQLGQRIDGRSPGLEHRLRQLQLQRARPAIR